MKVSNVDFPVYKTLRKIKCECGQAFILIAVMGSQEEPQFWSLEPNEKAGIYCPFCGKLSTVKEDA